MMYRWQKTDFTSASVGQGGPGIVKQIPWYTAPYLSMSRAQLNAQGKSIGDAWWVGGTTVASGGNAFAIVKTEANLVFGQLVARALPTTGTVTNNASQSTVYAVLTNINESSIGVNGDVDNFIFVNATGATLPQFRRIKANDASATATFTVSDYDRTLPNSPRDKDAFDTLATNADACAIIRPYNVIVNTATTVPCGVALGTVTAATGPYTVIQIAGIAMILADGDTTDLVVNQPAVGMAGGVLTGSAAAAANLYTGAGLMLPKFGKAGNGAAIPLYIPVEINFTGQ